MELVNIRVTALRPSGFTAAAGAGAARTARRSTRRARFEDGWCETTVLSGALSAGDEVEGPAVCELPEETIVVPPGWRGSVDAAGTLVLERA